LTKIECFWFTPAHILAQPARKRRDIVPPKAVSEEGDTFNESKAKALPPGCAIVVTPPE
jgi:hypothetical protein